MNIHLENPRDTPPSIREVELSQIDLRYEGHRLKEARLEARLLTSIAERDIQEPLEGFQLADASILLNGFKRYRCALKLKIPRVPFLCLGSNDVIAITRFLCLSNRKSLNILEQARFIDELKQSAGLSVGQISAELERSKAWVSMRLGLVSKLSPSVRDKLFAGEFPVYSYMYLARQFMRMNGVKSNAIDSFVGALSGKALSLREIEQLAHGFFRGPASFRQEILQGNITLALKQIHEVPQDPEACSEFERVLIKDLELLQKYMLQVMGKCNSAQLQSRPFFVQGHLLTAGILSQTSAFQQTLKEFHDRCRQA